MLPRKIQWCFRLERLLMLILIVALGVMVETAQAQTGDTNSTRLTAITDPREASALNNIFSHWGISANNRWNLSGNLCSGVAIDATAIDEINPGIKCDCSHANNTICHITNLWIYQRNVVGPIPEDMWNLTYLIDLNLGYNYLTGPISASIRNLNLMQYLSFGINALSGEVPRELGMLTDLRSLSFSLNNFSGPLPSEIGNLTRLSQLYIDSSGVSGPIPSAFARLLNMETMWAGDNVFTGRIPEFIGNLSRLNSLRLRGNSFQGPIPSSFVHLTSLTELLINDLVNGSSSLDFLMNKTALAILNLRNNNISGAIPTFLGEFQSLTYLDFSFNNLSGTVPNFLLNLSSLTYLFLGNNMLTGALPNQKSQRLQTIDLSYNELSGSFPSWIRQENLTINLVANNLIVNHSIRRVLPFGLECLQRNFPCRRNAPIYSRFAIKCGGPEITTRDQMVYDMENDTLGPATYQVTRTQRWAVSNVGLPSANTNNPRYRSFSSSIFSNTSDYELFQTARVSAGSLRYYGLGLQNGNYTVTLQFAETEFVGVRLWESLGRRVFDIYIQGNIQERDFNIEREAGGTLLRAVARQYTAQVRDNYLEIHFFWAGKGTCCIPRQGTFGPLISAIRATSDFDGTVPNVPPNFNKRNHDGMIVGIVVPIVAATLVFLASIGYVHHKREMQKKLENDALLGIDTRPYIYTYAELKVATENFSPSNKLGEGGFGPVYKGTLGDGRKVAVKQLSVPSDHGKCQFIAEIATISAVQHRNLVKLYGCCIEGVKRLLVYEFLENKSLDQLLFGLGSSRLYLDWPTRYDICLGVARGLAYLHEESQPRIVHRDVKASNILLDHSYTPKISDFGLAKLFDAKDTHISTRIAGTRGYLAPEYAMHGHLTEKADIFSFGVVVLEIVSGRPNSDLNFDDDKIYLLERAWNLHESNSQVELVDPTLCDFDEAIVKKVITIGLLCTQASPSTRPSMSRVVGMLTGDIEVMRVTSKPNYLTELNFDDVSMFRSSEVLISSTPNFSGSQMSTGYMS